MSKKKNGPITIMIMVIRQGEKRCFQVRRGRLLFLAPSLAAETFPGMSLLVKRKARVFHIIETGTTEKGPCFFGVSKNGEDRPTALLATQFQPGDVLEFAPTPGFDIEDLVKGWEAIPVLKKQKEVKEVYKNHGHQAHVRLRQFRKGLRTRRF